MPPNSLLCSFTGQTLARAKLSSFTVFHNFDVDSARNWYTLILLLSKCNIISIMQFFYGRCLLIRTNGSDAPTADICCAAVLCITYNYTHTYCTYVCMCCIKFCIRMCLSVLASYHTAG